MVFSLKAITFKLRDQYLKYIYLLMLWDYVIPWLVVLVSWMLLLFCVKTLCLYLEGEKSANLSFFELLLVLIRLISWENSDFVTGSFILYQWLGKKLDFTKMFLKVEVKIVDLLILHYFCSFCFHCTLSFFLLQVNAKWYWDKLCVFFLNGF